MNADIFKAVLAERDIAQKEVEQLKIKLAEFENIKTPDVFMTVIKEKAVLQDEAIALSAKFNRMTKCRDRFKEAAKALLRNNWSPECLALYDEADHNKYEVA